MTQAFMFCATNYGAEFESFFIFNLQSSKTKFFNIKLWKTQKNISKVAQISIIWDQKDTLLKNIKCSLVNKHCTITP